MAHLGIDLTDVTQEDLDSGGGGWLAMPEGWYRFVIQSSDYKQNHAGTGWRIGLQFHCVEPGQFAKQKLFEYLSVVHRNADTMRIARAHLKQLAIALNIHAGQQPLFAQPKVEIDEIVADRDYLGFDFLPRTHTSFGGKRAF